MKIDLSTPILALDGSEVKRGERALTLRDVCVQAIATPLQGDTDRDVGATVLAYGLALKLQGAKDPVVELTPEEVAKIRERIVKVFVLEVAGFALSKLNGDS